MAERYVRKRGENKDGERADGRRGETGKEIEQKIEERKRDR